MINLRLIFLFVWIFILPLASVLQHDAVASESSRWGITTNKKLEKDQNTPIDNSGLETMPTPEESRGNQQPAPATKKNTPPMNPAQTEHPASGEPKAAIGDSNKPSSTSHKNVPGRNKATPDAKGARPTTKAMIWASEQQKTTCQTYTKDLRELFVKTRHFSIQGAPCKTRDFAAAFRHVKEKCIKDCPEGFLRQSGYTDRIFRNITYLEKLGNDRCSDTKASEPKPQAN